MPNKWTIKSKDVHGDSHKSHLVDCQIQKNSAGTAYQFEAPDGTVVSTTTGSTLPSAPFTFPMFNSALKGKNTHDWYIGITTVTGGDNKDEVEGTWSNHAPDPKDAQDGTFTAQAGSDADADYDEDAQSASA